MVPSPERPRTALGPAVAALGGLYFFWGTTYLGIRLAIETMPPLLMAGTRFLIAGAILFAVTAPRRKPGERISLAHWRSSLLIGFFLLGVGNGGVTLGEQYVATGTVALLVATVPLWLLLLDWGVFHVRPALFALGGVVVGLAGVGLLIGRGGGGSVLAELLVLISPLGWAAGSLYARGAAHPHNQLTAAAMEMLLGGAVLVVAALLHGEATAVHLDRLSATSVLGFGYLVVFGSWVGYSCYVWLLRTLPTQIVATYAYVNPLVAVVLGAAFLGERVTAQTFLAGGLIIVAVALIVAFPAHRRGAEPVEPVSEVS